ncbi:hypothetical protein IW152_001881 [Coemansia sp. BCRC 34962]|nr:hypothetical protein IW152_001881 [Coemansia sp. BCRC 34962]
MAGDAELVEFFKCFPLLLPITLAPFRADGCIEVPEGPRAPITIDVESAGGRYSVAAIKSTPEIEQYLGDKSHELDTRFNQCTSPLSFVRELQYSLFYAQIIRECDELEEWSCVESFDEKSQVMTLEQKDGSGKSYRVYADFDREVFSTDIDGHTTAMDIGLPSYLEKLKEICLRMSGSWRVLDDVDGSLQVLQPQHPRRYDLWRRVAVGDLVSALIEVSSDCYHPKVVFYGPASIAGPLNSRAKDLRVEWDGPRGVKDNLEKILDIELPGPSTVYQEDSKIKCGICLSFEDDGNIADQVCTSDLCAQSFHRQCLIQWLTTKEDTRRSYSTYFGKCPYCKGNMVVASS